MEFLPAGFGGVVAEEETRPLGGAPGLAVDVLGLGGGHKRPPHPRLHN